MYIADLLSRSYIKNNIDDDLKMLKVVHCLKVEYPISNGRIEDIKGKTKSHNSFRIIKE